MPMTSKLSSIPRRHVLWLLLIFLIGWQVSARMNGSEGKTFEPAAWASFASVVSGAAASMVGLTVALAAILYALLGTPLIKFLHEKGALNRVLFDLIVGAAIWLVALMSSIISAHPNSTSQGYLMQLATICAVAGALHFLSIGWAFWLLLRNSGVERHPSISHDFRKSTDLDT